MTVHYDISVIVCTYNRAQMLRDTLDSWACVDKANIAAELIIVDNQSTDLTSEVVSDFKNNHEHDVKYVHEPDIGLSNARNRGIRESSSAIIAFVDDDVYFDRDWLKEILRVFKEKPEIHCAGGNSIPVFDSDKPEWLNDSLLQIYGSTRSGEVEKFMQYPEHPFGVNMAFRRVTFERIGLFNTRLGRIKTSLLSNEEKELFYRIDQGGLKTYYTPKAVIYHRVPRERLQPAWVIKRHFGQGLSKVAFDQIVDKKGRLTLLKDAVVHLKRALLGTKPFSIRKTLFYYKRHPMNVRLQNATSLGIAKQCFIEMLGASR